jgi:pimeloyl-ACP methyl ester carboxylesterase
VIENLIRREDCEIAFEELTPREPPGNGRQLVLLHGFGTDRARVRALAISLLSARAHDRAISIDLRGHGQTRVGRGSAESDRGAYSYRAMQEDLVSLLQAESPTGADLVGHSMGGQIALMAAIDSPDLVHSLTAIGAGPCRAVTDERERKSWQRAADFFERASPPALAAALAEAAPADATTHPELEPERLYADANGPELANVIRGGFLHVESNDEACRSLHRPTLVLAGSRDTGWLDPSRKLATLIPTATLTIIEAAGHWAHIENQPACTQAIQTFWTP